MVDPSADRLLRVQTVLYATPRTAVWRLLRGLSAAVRHARTAGVIEEVEWALGDCGIDPSLGEEDTADLARAAAPLARVTYRHFGENAGHAGGQNRLADGAPADLLLLLNPDTYPAPNAITELIRQRRRRRAAVVDGRQIPLEHPKSYDLRTGDVGWASGACMLVDAPVFAEVGGFDAEHFPLHCDDVDFSWRVRAAGGRIVTAPLAAVFHDKRPTGTTPWPAPEPETYHATLGRLMLARRWGRDDIVEETVAAVLAAGDEVQGRAVETFTARRAEGRVPDVHPRTDVAEFVDGEYAPHRF